MPTTNPQEFCAQFRDELHRDLGYTPSLCCPKCVITYIDTGYEGDCYHDSEDNMAIVCAFDYEDTPLTEVIGYWKEAVLKCCRFAEGEDPEKTGLTEKWRQRLYTHTPA
jgi:hypothetical protein